MQLRISFRYFVCAIVFAVCGVAEESQESRVAAADTEQVSFADFFKTPVGEQGLELSARMLALRGKRVSIVGYMVQEQVEEAHDHGHGAAPCVSPVPRRFMLTATPQTINPGHYGPCDGLPPQVLYVHVADAAAVAVPYRPGLLRVTGRLELGSWREADERISQVRLRLDAGSLFSAAAQE